VEHRKPAVEEPVAEAEPGIDHGAPGLATNQAVCREAPCPLEALDGFQCSLAETAGQILAYGVAEHHQPILDVADRFPGITESVYGH
jgi:hypothetical protein